MKRQRQQHEDVWQLFVQACGSKCCVCGKTGVPLYRGHIQRKADDGPDSLANLIPICKPCNSAHSKTYTPAWRPDDWRSIFIKLMSQHLGINVVYHVNRVGTHFDRSQPADEKRVIPLDEIDFGTEKQVLTHICVHTSSPPTLEEIKAAIMDAVLRGHNHQVSIPAPSRKVHDKLQGLARLHGVKTFADAAREMIEREDWYDTHGNMLQRLYRGQEWDRFCDNFDMYVYEHKLRAERRAKQAEADREHQKRMELWRAADERRAFKQQWIAAIERRIANVSDVREFKDELKRIKDTCVDVNLAELEPLLKDLDRQITEIENGPGPEALF